MKDIPNQKYRKKTNLHNNRNHSPNPRINPRRIIINHNSLSRGNHRTETRITRITKMARITRIIRITRNTRTTRTTNQHKTNHVQFSRHGKVESQRVGAKVAIRISQGVAMAHGPTINHGAMPQNLVTRTQTGITAKGLNGVVVVISMFCSQPL